MSLVDEAVNNWELHRKGVIAEVENIAGGFTSAYLDDIAGVAVLTPRP